MSYQAGNGRPPAFLTDNSTVVVALIYGRHKYRKHKALEAARFSRDDSQCPFHAERGALDAEKNHYDSLALHGPDPPPWYYSNQQHPLDLTLLRTCTAPDKTPVSKNDAEIVVAAAETAQRTRSSTIGSVRSPQASLPATFGPESISIPIPCHLKWSPTLVVPDVNGRRNRKSVDPRELGHAETLPTILSAADDVDLITPVTSRAPKRGISHAELPRLRTYQYSWFSVADMSPVGDHLQGGSLDHLRE